MLQRSEQAARRAGRNAKRSVMMVKSPAGPPPERYDAPGGSWPPGPKGLPFLGNLLEFRRDALRYYSEWTRQYGDMVALRLGVWPAVLLNHSDHAEYVLVRNANNFIKFPFFFRHVHAIFGRGLLTSEGEFWHRQRQLAAQPFTPSGSPRTATPWSGTPRVCSRTGSPATCVTCTRTAWP